MEARMSDTFRYTILGCGSSAGVPRIGNDWGECDPQNPKNRRRRCAMLVERISQNGITRALIDPARIFASSCSRQTFPS